MPKPSNTRAGLYLLCWALALIAGCLLPWWGGAFILGVVFWQAFVILHACGHQAFFNHRWANHLTGRLMSPLCTLPYGMWRHLHQQHHYWSGWKDLDPTLSEANRPRPQWQQSVMKFCWHYWIPIFSVGYMASTFWAPKQVRYLRDGQRAEALLDVLLLALGFAAFFILAPRSWILHWLAGYLVFLSLADLSVLCQHIHLPHEFSKGEKVRPFTGSEQERFAREVRAPQWLELWVFGNFNRHASHHIWPRLAPYYAQHITGKRLHEESAWRWLWEAKRMSVIELLQEETRER